MHGDRKGCEKGREDRCGLPRLKQIHRGGMGITKRREDWNKEKKEGGKQLATDLFRALHIFQLSHGLITERQHHFFQRAII